MAGLKTFNDEHYSAGSRSYLSMKNWDDDFREGLCWTRHGFVLIWQSAGHRRSTQLVMIRGGLVHNRSWPEVWADRTLQRLAREFAEVVGVAA